MVVPRDAISALLHGELRTPHDVLGAHPAALDGVSGVVIRARVPKATQLWMELNGERLPMDCVQDALFVRFVAGETQLAPLNEKWDREILGQFEMGDFAALEEMRDADISRLGGAAAHEIRTWFAALGALRAFGDYKVQETFYACVPEWIVAFGALRAVA